MEEKYMRRALELARSAEGHTSPNPMVGCVVVKEDRIITEGCHERYGEFHAERNALTRCQEDVTGAEMYVTLEPCCHQGKTPPCTDIIMEKGIGTVYVGSMDPNPKVAGNGVKILRDHGIHVETGILEEECLALNEIFFHYIQTQTPFVAMKYAMTMDGKIATVNGDSKWITGEVARHHVQTLRRKYSAIMAGVDTIIADDAMLNCRIEENVDPIRVICDSRLRIPMTSQIIKTAKEIPTIIAYTKAEGTQIQKLETTGVELLKCGDSGHVNLSLLMKKLGEKKIDSVLVEGGGTIHGSLLQEKLVNRIYAYVAPKIIGGRDAKSPVEGEGVTYMREAMEFEKMEVISLGEDFCLTAARKETRK